MTEEENIRAILECNFAGYKEEIIENAVKRICELKHDSYYKDLANSYEKTINILTKAISEQEPKIGHWIDGHCSECGCDIPAYIIDWKWQKDMDAKYCPTCGAKMEG